MRDAARAFLAGLTTPSWGSVVGAALFAALELGSAAALLTEGHLARIDPRWLMEGPRDDYAKLTVDALRMKHASDVGLSVAYMGPSTARLALLHAEAPAAIEDDLARQTGEHVVFHELCSDAQTLEDALVLSDQIPDGFRGVVVVVVSDTRDDRRNEQTRSEEPRLHRAREALASPTDDAYALEQGKEVPKATGNYLVDNFDFFAVRRGALARLTRSPARPVIEAVRRPETPAEEAQWTRRMNVAWSYARRDYELREKLAILKRYLPLLEELVRTWQARGIQGVLLEAPANPRYEALKGAGQRTVYRRAMSSFAERAGVPYWDLNDEMRFDGLDFADHIHLNDRGARQRFESAIVRRLGVLLRGMAAHPPPLGRDAKRPSLALPRPGGAP